MRGQDDPGHQHHEHLRDAQRSWSLRGRRNVQVVLGVLARAPFDEREDRRVIQSTPNPPGTGTTGSLFGVSCTSDTACTAVGGYRDSSNVARTLVERWDGTSWTIQSSPTPSNVGFSSFFEVSCTSATACTAVGER